MSKLEEGDVVSIRTPGAGGYGDPIDRNKKALENDVLDGKVTTEAAARDYGVKVD